MKCDCLLYTFCNLSGILKMIFHDYLTTQETMVNVELYYLSLKLYPVRSLFLHLNPPQKYTGHIETKDKFECVKLLKKEFESLPQLDADSFIGIKL